MTSNCELPVRLDYVLLLFARFMSLTILNRVAVLMAAPSRELHGDTLAALQEFYAERLSKENRFQDLRSDIEKKSAEAQLSMDMFSDDWNASQFWVCSRHREIPSVF